MELAPQGNNLAERIRAAGAGIGAFFTPTRARTVLADGKEVSILDGCAQVLGYPIRADFALVKCHRAGRLGNLLYRKTARNFGPLMATAAATTIVQTEHLVEVGELDPESIVTPSIYVNRLVRIPTAARMPAGGEEA